jgi:two-component system OmpR family response regulator
MIKYNILIAEDDKDIRLLLKGYLIKEGFEVDAVEDGQKLDQWLSKHKEPDIIILDIMMPHEDGLSICRRLRTSSDVAIIMLTARSDDIDRIVGLEMGADDYICKPFNPRELVARIRAILRRKYHSKKSCAIYKIDKITVNLDTHEVKSDTEIINLTSAEYGILSCFIQNPLKVLSREQLLDMTRSRIYDPYDRTIDVSISRLRKKVAKYGCELAIRTVRNSGYMLATNVEEYQGN